MIGKRGGISFLLGLTVTAFNFGGDRLVHAYVGETVVPTQLKIDLNPASKINEITAPLNNFINSALNGFRLNKNINIGTGIPISPIKSPSQVTDFSKFFSSSKLSANDVMSFLKEAAVTGINLSILVISVTAQVLKGILSVFNK